MRFTINRLHRYRMPVVFGPSCGPRQGPDRETFDYDGSSRTRVAVTFLCDAARLRALLPEHFSRDGERDRVRGPFLAILWENMPEPIPTGREELRFAGLYCENPRPHIVNGVHHHAGAWDSVATAISSAARRRCRSTAHLGTVAHHVPQRQHAGRPAGS